MARNDSVSPASGFVLPAVEMFQPNYFANKPFGENYSNEHPNCSCEMFEASFSEGYRRFNSALILTSLPVVAIFGIITNIINVVVYSRPGLLRISGNLYLLALAGSDFFVVILGTLSFWGDSGKANFHSPTIISVINQILVWALPIGYIAQTASIYFTLAAALDCYVLVCWPCCSKKWCSTKTATRMIIAVVLWSIGYNVVRFFTLETEPCYYWPPGSNKAVEILEICTTAVYHQINSVYNIYLYLILMTMFPFFLLSIMNALIIRNVQMRKRFFAVFYIRRLSMLFMRAAEKRRMSHLPAPTFIMAPPKASNIDDELQDEIGESADETNTVTLIMVVILFLTCNVLALVVNMTENFFQPSGEALNYMTDVSNFLVILNSSANFLIYVKYSLEYRLVLDALVENCCFACWGTLWLPPPKSGTLPTRALRTCGSVRPNSPIMLCGRTRLTGPCKDVNYYTSVPDSSTSNGLAKYAMTPSTTCETTLLNSPDGIASANSDIISMDRRRLENQNGNFHCGAPTIELSLGIRGSENRASILAERRRAANILHAFDKLAFVDEAVSEQDEC